MNWRVSISDDLDNTGLDSAVFATREEADKALATTNGMFGTEKVQGEVQPTDKPVTTTLAEWEAAGW